MAINKRLIKSNEGGAELTTSFNTVLYAGNNITNPITGVGFEPDLVWVKNRGLSVDHFLTNSVSGAGAYLVSNSTNAEDTTARFNSFDSDGFSVSTDTTLLNNSSYNYVAWCWKAGGAAVTNTDGTITSQVSANQGAGFSVVSYTGSGATATVGHGLNSVVDLLIVKGRETTNDWSVLHKDNTDGNFLQLNGTAAESGSGSIFGSPTARPTDSVFTIGNAGETGTLNKTYIAYCFAEVAGFSKFGSYTGNGTTSNTIITGFEPAFVMTKRTDAAGTDWHIWDNKRNPSNPLTLPLFPNEPYAETDYSAYPHNFLSNGFSVNTSNGAFNASGGTYIYMAFANQF